MGIFHHRNIENCLSWEVTSSFQDPGHWNKHFRHAKHLSEVPPGISRAEKLAFF